MPEVSGVSVVNVVNERPGAGFFRRALFAAEWLLLPLSYAWASLGDPAGYAE